MKIAYFSPLPPKHTGIATYSFHLGRALAAHAELDFFDGGVAQSPVPGRPVIDYVAEPEALLDLPGYDAVLYHLGNNPEFHLDIYRALLVQPGLVVLHDAVLYFLAAGLPQGGMLREFLFNYGPDRVDEFFAIERDSVEQNVLRYPHPERYPFLARVFERATGIVVHSGASSAFLRAAGYRGQVHIIPLLAYPSHSGPSDPGEMAAVRSELGLVDGELLIGSFGFIGATKRMKVVFEALQRLKGRLPFKLLIVGTGNDLAPEIAARGLDAHVVRPGFVDEAAFNRLLRTTDILVNLRFPSMGETSATLIQAMACGVPSVVSDDSWFAELPDDAVYKVPVGSGEVGAVEHALLHLWSDTPRRAAIGAAGCVYARTVCGPEIVAKAYIEVMGQAKPPAEDRASSWLDAPLAGSPPSRSDGAGFASPPSSDDLWVRSYFYERIERAIGA